MIGYALSDDGQFKPVRVKKDGTSVYLHSKGEVGKMQPKKFTKKPRNQKRKSK